MTSSDVKDAFEQVVDNIFPFALTTKNRNFRESSQIPLAQ
jgi:hypothetical protein